jgi:hypothetical protein
VPPGVVTVSKYVVPWSTAGTTAVREAPLPLTVTLLTGTVIMPTAGTVALPAGGCGAITLSLLGTPPDSSTKFTVVAPATNPEPVMVTQPVGCCEHGTPVVPPVISPDVESPEVELILLTVGTTGDHSQLLTVMVVPQ